MADDDITLDGKPLQSLRVADLKAALEQRNLPKTGQKNTLIKRLKGALMLENLQKSSSSHGGLQPNSQMGEEMSQNSFIKQYLAKQQELLRQRLEREAQQEEEEEADESSAVEERDHMDDNDDSAYVSEKPPLSRTEERQVGEPFPHGIMAFGSGMVSGATLHGAESREPPGAMLQRASFYQGNREPPAPSPPRAVASLSVRVLGQPECQGLPPAVPQMQEKASTASSQSAHPVLHLSRSAGAVPAAAAHEDSDEDDASNDDSDDDDDWGPTASRRSSRVPPQPQPPSVPPASGRSKRKLQPPQHIPPPQLHSPLQLRHPTPPPSPPPNLFPLPDTPKQSPPDADHPTGEGSKMASFPPATMQGQESDSSSRSSSPEPPAKRRPGPLSLLVHKMESEQALDEAQSTSAADMSGEEAQATARSDGAAGVSQSPLKRLEKRRQQENIDEKIRQEEKTKKEEGKKCLEEGRERKQLEEKEKKTDEKMKHQEKSRQEEKWTKRQQTSEQDKMSYSSARVLTEAQDSGSSSDSDSSSRSYSSEKQSETTRKIKKGDQEQKKDGDGQIFLTSVEEKQHSTKREVSEPSAAAVTEEEPDSESAMALPPASGAEPENSEGPVEESTTPKAFAARKLSLTSNKMSPASAERGGEPETTNAAGRKRRWGSSTAVSAKKPSISITTDSLKSLIPDIKVNQEAVVDLPAEELQYSGDEETMDSTHEDQDNGLKIQRTVTQVVPSDSQKNGQGNEEEDGEKTDREKSRRASKDRRKDSVSEEATEPITSVKPEEEPKKVIPSDSLVRRSISQQKSGVSVTIDDPIRTNRKPSPPRGKVTNIIHVTNLVRPFTLGQLKELLNQTGSMVEDGFWIDKIKSHCYVTYSTAEEAASTRNALHGVKWPQSNPKVLSVDFCEQDEVDFHKGILKEKETDHGAPVPSVPQNRLPPLMPERDRERDKDRERDRGMGGVRDLWAEREREMERRERARGEREWDRDKIREFARPGEDGRRSRSRDRDRRRRERAKSKERKTEKKEKADEPPAKLLDDLFLKTKAAPCIYWLPLTDEQAAQRVSDRTERQKERERIRKELDEENKKKREEEKKERLKAREKEGGAVASGGGPARRVSEGDRDRDRGRDREGDRRRDSGHRPRRLSAGNARRSRSRSNPRERRH